MRSKSFLKIKSNCLLSVVALVILLFALHANASDQIPAKRQDHPIALVGGTVHPVNGPAIVSGTVLFIDGKITAVGSNVNLPTGAEQIDVSGKHVYPGLIATNTILGLTEIGSVRATLDAAEIGDIKPNVRAEAAINPDSELLPVTRANGVTIAQSVPSGGLISGTSATIMLDGWTWEHLTLRAPTGLHVQWPGARRGRFFRRSTHSEEERHKAMQENIQKIKTAFAEARAYMTAKEAESQKGVPYHDTDLRWEAMIPVLKKEVPVFLHANAMSQIQQAIDWALDEDVKMVLVGGQDAWRVTDLLKEKSIPVIIGGVLNTPRRRWEPYETPFTNALKLHESGVSFCIGFSGREASNARNLAYHAAMAAAYGLPKEEALKSITLYPAQILGIADRVGSIQVGKDATLIVTNGDPLEITTAVEHEFIQGRKVDLTSRHTQLYEKYKVKYEQLKKQNLMTTKSSE
ncbi:amidohydrolase family protein [bacterium]|nr:amidohydrolase family protein [bacterium]